jgi:hypothetical protein
VFRGREGAKPLQDRHYSSAYTHNRRMNMAGRPLIQAQCEDLEAIGEETLLDLVEGGMTLRTLFITFDIGRRSFYKWLDLEPNRRELFSQAREVYAEELDHEGLKIADDCKPDKDMVAVAKLRIEQRRHVALNADKGRRDKTPQGVTNISIGELHLTAVKEAQPPKLKAGDDEGIEEGVYTIEDEGGDDD